MFKKLQKKVSRQREGKSATKFRFEVIVKSVENVDKKVTSCRVVWSKGAKLQMTKVQSVTNGTAVFEDSLQILSSIYRDAKGDVEPKPYSVKIQYPAKGDPKNMQTAAKLEVDMARYAGVGNQQHEETLALPTKDGKAKFIVKALIISNIIQHTDMDGMTEISGITGVSSEDYDQNLSGFESSGFDSEPSNSLARGDVSDMSQSMAMLGDENEKLRNDIYELRYELDQAKNAEAQLNEVMEDNEQLREQVEAMQAQIVKVQQNAANEKQKLIEEQLANAQADGNSAEAEILKVRADLQRQLNASNEELNSSQLKCNQLQDSLSALQSQHDKLTAQKLESDTKFSNTQRELESHKMQIETLSSQMKSAGSDSENRVTELSLKVDELHLKLKESYEQAEDLRIGLTEKNNNLDDTSTKIVALEEAVKIKEDEAKEMKSKTDKELQDVKNQMEAERAEKSVLERQLQEKLDNEYLGEEATKEAVEMAVAAKEAKYAKLKEQYEQEIEQYNQDRLELEESILDLQTQLQQSENSRRNLETEKRSLELALQDTAGERLELERERGDLEKELARQRKQLNDANCETLEKENIMLIQSLASAKLHIAEMSEQILLLKKEVHRKSETNMKLASKLTKMEAQAYRKRQ